MVSCVLDEGFPFEFPVDKCASYYPTIVKQLTSIRQLSRLVRFSENKFQAIQNSLDSCIIPYFWTDVDIRLSSAWMINYTIVLSYQLINVKNIAPFEIKQTILASGRSSLNKTGGILSNWWDLPHSSDVTTINQLCVSVIQLRPDWSKAFEGFFHPSNTALYFGKQFFF